MFKYNGWEKKERTFYGMIPGFPIKHRSRLHPTHSAASGSTRPSADGHISRIDAWMTSGALVAIQT